MNLFLCLILIIFQPINVRFIHSKLEVNTTKTADRIVALRYRGRNLEENAIVEVEIAASCATCTSNYIGAIALKDKDNNIIDSFQKSIKFTGKSIFNMAIKDEILVNYDKISIQVLIVFPNNGELGVQRKIDVEIENISKDTIRVEKDVATFRKKSPYYIEKLEDGSMTKLYETYGFTNMVYVEYDTNEIDIQSLSFQYSDSLLNEIPLHYKEAYLLLENMYTQSDITLQENKLFFPLNITCNEYKCKFSLLKNYYYDYEVDALYSTYKAGRIATNKIKLPSSFDNSNEISYQIIVEDAGAYGDKLLINGKFKVSYKLFGACENSKYCVAKTNKFTGDIEYEQTIKISS